MGNDMSDPSETVSNWLSGLERGDSRCAQQLYDAIYDRLVRIARGKLAGRGRWRDEEDVAASVMRIFFAGAPKGKFPKLDDRDDLWKILVTITTRKVRDYTRRRAVEVCGESVLGAPADSSNLAGLDGIGDSALAPQLAVISREASRDLLESLGDPDLAQIAVWKMEGLTNAEIAKKLKVAEETARRKVERIRQKWSKHLAADEEE